MWEINMNPSNLKIAAAQHFDVLTEEGNEAIGPICV